jgi:DNA-binding XRE family transcriptional regulator
MDATLIVIDSDADRPKTEIAKLLGVSRQTLYDILEEKQPVTPVMALRMRRSSSKICASRRAIVSQPTNGALRLFERTRGHAVSYQPQGTRTESSIFDDRVASEEIVAEPVNGGQQSGPLVCASRRIDAQQDDAGGPAVLDERPSHRNPCLPSAASDFRDARGS